MVKKKSNVKVKEEQIRVPPLDVKTLVVLVKNREGSSLLSARFPESAIKQILDKQTGKARASQRKRKEPEKMYEASLYPLMEKKGCCGFPAIGFKLACVNACRYNKDFTMTTMYGAINVVGPYTVEGDSRDFVEIIGTPEMRRDTTRNPNTSGADVVFRGEFRSWSAKLRIVYNSAVLSKEQVVDLLRLAGFHVGVGPWRPACKGNHGLFDVTKYVVVEERGKKEE